MFGCAHGVPIENHLPYPTFPRRNQVDFIFHQISYRLRKIPYLML